MADTTSKWMLIFMLLLTSGTNVSAQPKQEGNPMAPKPTRLTVNLSTNRWTLYPRREDIALLAIDRLAEGVGVRLSLHSDMAGFSHFLYAVNDAPFQKSAGRTVEIGFEDNHQPEIQRTVTRLKAVSSTGDTSKAYEIGINYYPKEHYAAGGQTSPGWVIVQQTDLALVTSRVEDWILQQPSPQEKAYARKKWGRLIRDDRPDYENACALARSIIDDLHPHRGIPSDEMGNLSAFDQYERVMAGKDRLWCGNIAGIFTYACNALGIPCRSMGMNRPVNPQPPDGPNLLLAEGHGTTEIFSRDLNQWIWIDLTFYILGAYLGEEGPIHMAELYDFLNVPARAKNLRIVVYDPDIKTDKTVAALKSDKKLALLNYFKQDQEFHYSRWREKGQ